MTRREEVELAWLNKAVQSYHRYDEKSFKEAVEWANKTMIEKAVKWLTNNWREYVYQDGDGIVHFGHWESDFRKAMEE